MATQVNAQWKCELQGLSAEGKSEALPESLTVGTKLLMTCDGPPAKLNAEKLKIVLDPKGLPPFKIIDVRELKETGASLVVAPWLVGEAKLKNPTLTDESVTVGLGDLNLTIASVIDPAKNPENKPFPPLNPMTLAWPLWLWLFVGALVLGVVYGVGLLVRQSLRRKQLLALLEKNAVALSPLNHFNKELRRLMRQIPQGATAWEAKTSQEFFSSLETEFRWFLARELVVPSVDGSTSLILKSIKKSDRDLYKNVSKDLRVVLTELGKASRLTTSLSSQDAIQLVDLSRNLADRIAKERNA